MGPIDLLQDLLRTRTVNPPGEEAAAADILKAYLSAAGLNTKILDHRRVVRA